MSFFCSKLEAVERSSKPYLSYKNADYAHDLTSGTQNPTSRLQTIQSCGYATVRARLQKTVERWEPRLIAQINNFGVMRHGA